ncbi:MAG TPA: hypothetical protein VEC14_15070, partial [Reyranellaceae bacterium]|nr:hypothetical protein [Reyranellaceae bacterium]
GAEECRDVGGAGKLVEAAFLDRLDVGAANPQALTDIGEAEAELFTLIAEQTTDGARGCSLALRRTPINLIRH